MARDREALTKGDLTNCSEHSPADREFLRPVPTQAFKECTNINVTEKTESWVHFYSFSSNAFHNLTGNFR